MPIPTRKIGDKEFPAIGFGLMGISIAYGTINMTDEERLKVLDRAYELGCIHWDTSIVYGDSEALIGKWFERTGKRSEIFLATKFGIKFDAKTYAFSTDNSAACMRSSLEKSLSDLKTDYIDLYYVHRIQKTQPIEVTVRELAKYVKEGKIRHIGLSECSSATLRRAHAVHPIAAVQVEYSPFQLDIESEKIGILKTAKELGIQVVAYSPLGRGLLTGQIKSLNDLEDTDFRKNLPMYVENFDKVLGISDKLKDIGKRHNATAGQIALAWLLTRGDNVITIPGTKRIKYLEENYKALEINLSSKEQDEVLDAINAASLVAGDRYPANMVDALFADTVELEE
ncbi:hypothetical protein M422DRAFT_75515 [Sphaerobolus stellatus SS14]|uniref:Unplaced genomic scaffold SPHSTscaffold_47, whole genome shotgun sequence n=1 Tax=Sphaerobolus stellatus (strain SS14) TaxID=990650 RepID=A0A0C9UKG7_SPHS4|nr:hypothetical protein M422DRAFT_75515 [Sphaerobolus stellatus SS14]